MMDRGMCTCDEEHMFTCPTSVPMIDSEKGQEEKTQLDKMLNSLLSDKVRITYRIHSKKNKNLSTCNKGSQKLDVVVTLKLQTFVALYT